MSNKRDDKQHSDTEQRINALLDGELDPEGAAELRQLAEDDPQLARDIIDAHQLQQQLEQMGIQRAPASLRRRLRAIPREQRRRERGWARGFGWGLATAFSLALVTVLVLQQREEQPSAEELALAKQEFALAMHYLKSYSDKSRRVMAHQVGQNTRDAFREGVRTGVASDPIQDMNPGLDIDLDRSDV